MQFPKCGAWSCLAYAECVSPTHPRHHVICFFIARHHLHAVIVRDVVVEDVTPPVELVPRDAAHHASALELVLQRRFLVSQLRETGDESHQHRQDEGERYLRKMHSGNMVVCEYLNQDRMFHAYFG